MAATNREAFTSPVGRLVQGDCFEAQTKDQQGNLRVVKTGPNAGQPAPQFFVAVAFPKNDPAWPAFMGALHRVATAEWPGFFPAGAPVVNVFGIGAPAPTNPVFSFKVKDGDGVDRQGRANNTKEGFAGHWVVSFASSYPPKVVRPAGPNVWETVTKDTKVPKPDGSGLTGLVRGHYVRVAGSVSSNNNTQNPGLYVNLDMIEWTGLGVEIMSGPDAGTAFGGAAALPAGAAALPPSVGGGFGAPPAAPAAYAAPPAAPAAYAAPPAAPAPYAGYMGNAAPGAGAPPPPPSPSAPPAMISPSKTMTAAAGGATYESFLAQGWTDEQMIAGGYLVVA